MALWKTLNDKVFYGEGSLAALETILKETLTENEGNILLFVDKNGFVPSGAAAYFEELKKKQETQNINIKEIAYAGKALPIEDIEELYRQINDKEVFAPDMIIAVGGGTVIDLAKILAVACSNGCERAEEVLDNKILENNIPLVFIPTTAGTGSETTSFAVVYRDKVKISVQRESLLPHHIILDPLLLKSLPLPILKATVLDALAQAVESAWAVGSTAESKEYSARAIPLIMNNIDDIDNLVDENRIERLSALQQAAYWAGKAINVSKTTLSHSISYPITSYFGVPHGIAVFLTLPEVARLNFSSTAENKQAKIELKRIEESFSLLFDLFGAVTIDELVGKLKNVMEKFSVSLRLRDYGMAEKDLEFLAANALTKGRSDNNPRNLSESEVLELLKRIY